MSDAIQPFRHRDPPGRPRLPARPARQRPLARRAARRGVDPRHTAGLPDGARRVLAYGVRLAGPGGAAQPVPTVRHRDRRSAHPLPARQVRPARREAAADHARLPELGRRVPAPDRAAGQPGRGPGLPRRRAVAARLRVLDPAERDRLDDGPHRAGLGRADAPARLRAVRRARRRRRRRRVRHGRRHRRRARDRRPRGDRSADRGERRHVPSRYGRPARRERPGRQADPGADGRVHARTAPATWRSRTAGRRPSGTAWSTRRCCSWPGSPRSSTSGPTCRSTATSCSPRSACTGSPAAAPPPRTPCTSRRTRPTGARRRPYRRASRSSAPTRRYAS